MVCAGKTELGAAPSPRTLPGPQMRGTGGTRIVVWTKRRDRGARIHIVFCFYDSIRVSESKPLIFS